MTRSAGNSPPPLSGVTLFIERPLGKKIATAIRGPGVSVVAHWECLPEKATDAEYIELCAKNGWIPLTADSDVNSDPVQRFLIKQARLQVFRLTRNHWSWQEKLEAFKAGVSEIERLIKSRRGPFIARLSRSGKDRQD